MLSQSTITEVHELDVLLIGNLAAIAADILAAKTSRYKLGVAHLETQLEEPSLFPIASTSISVPAKPKGVQVIRQRIRKINAANKYALLEDGKKIIYQMLVYGEPSRQWKLPDNRNPFSQALLTPYSLVYTGANPQWVKILSCKSGNLVFYIGKGPNNFEQNYPFLYFLERLNREEQQQLRMIIVMEGQNFYQFCPLAHRILEQQLRGAKFKIITNATVGEVDYLKRTIQVVSRDVTETISYAAVYCCLPEGSPELLARNGIDPYRNHERYLHNLQHDSLYILGGCTLPTTHSFTAINHQLHVVVANVKQRLDYMYGLSQKLALSVYRGTTAIRIYLSDRELVQIVHGYKDHEHQIRKTCTRASFFLSEHLDHFLAEKYYNFKSYGLPHFICSPWSTSDSTDEESTLSQLQLRQQQL